MRVFKFYSGDFFYGICSTTRKSAEKYLLEDIDDIPADKVEEIPESLWDERNIAMYEDNDLSATPFYESIRERLSCHTELIFTNDFSGF